MPLKIVYLDDEPDLCEMFRETFESAQVNIETFTDPALAIEAINRNPPDLVFLDFRLPGTTGEVLAGKIDPRIPMVLISGDLGTAVVSPFLKVFTKPFDFAEMAAFIQTYVAPK